MQRTTATWLVAVLAILVRGGVMLLPDTLQGDPDGYFRLAQNVVDRGCYGRGDIPTAYRPPLYPLTLALVLSLGGGRAGVAALHGVMGLATVALTVWLGRRWHLGRWSIVAAALVAIDPVLLRQSTLVMTETMAAWLGCLALLALTVAAGRARDDAAAAGRPEKSFSVPALGAALTLGMASLCRPTFFPWAALALPALAMCSAGWPKRIARGLLLAIVLLLVLLPWAYRNWRQFGRPILGTTHGGYTLLLGNNPWFYDHLRSGRWGEAWAADGFFADWQSRLDAKPLGDEQAVDRMAYEFAHATIREQPTMFAYAALVRMTRLWSPLPQRVDLSETPLHRTLRWSVAAFYTIELALAAVGLWALLRGAPAAARSPASARLTFWTTWGWGLALAAVFTGVHALYWTDIRMRAPLMPVVALAAAAGLRRLTASVEHP